MQKRWIMKNKIKYRIWIGVNKEIESKTKPTPFGDTKATTIGVINIFPDPDQQKAIQKILNLDFEKVQFENRNFRPPDE